MRKLILINLVLTCIGTLTLAQFTTRGIAMLLTLVGWLIYLGLALYLIYPFVKLVLSKNLTYLKEGLSVLAFLLAFHLAGPSDMIAFFDGKKVFQGGCEHTMDWVDLTLLKDHSAFMQSGMPRYAGRQYGTWSVKNDTVHIAIKTDSLLNSYNLIIKPGVGLFVVDHDKKNYNHNHSFFGDTKKLTKFFD